MEKRPKAGERDEAFRLIEDMLQLMEHRGLTELEMAYRGVHVRLKRGQAGPGPQIVEFSPGVAVPSTAPTAAGGAIGGAPSESRRILIKSPMVGTFYRAPAPDAPPFVDLGQEVEVGQVVCIIEAMKLMNEIKAEVVGRVVEVFLESGSPIEYGQPLFAIEPPG